jgi:hypothetical protein
MARTERIVEKAEPTVEPVTETITYTPGQNDPAVVKWCGQTFHANVPKDITGHAEGSVKEQLNFHLIQSARDNKHFKVGNAKPKRDPAALPTTAEGYRSYMVEWLKDPSIQHADELIARFARDRELQATCEVGSDDYSYLSTLFMPKLHELARGDDLNEPQVAAIWIQNCFNVLPW